MLDLSPFAFIGLLLVLGSTYALMRVYIGMDEHWLGWLMVLSCGFLLIYLAG